MARIKDLVEYIVTYEYNEARLVTPERLRYLLYFLQWEWANENSFRDALFDSPIMLIHGHLEIPDIEGYLAEQKKPHIYIPKKRDLWGIICDPYERIFIDKTLLKLSAYSEVTMVNSAHLHECWRIAHSHGDRAEIKVRDMRIPTKCSCRSNTKCKKPCQQ